MALLGWQGKLEYNLSGLTGGSWVELTLARDVMIDVKDDEVDVTVRGGGGYKQIEPGLRALSFEFDLLHVNGDANIDAIRTAYIARTSFGIRGYNESSGDGWQANVKVTQFPEGQPLAGEQAIKVICKPCYHAMNPSYNDAA